MGLKEWLNESPGAKIIEAEEAAKAARQKVKEQETARPFDPRTEVSADAHFISMAINKRLTLLLFWVPLLVGVILAALYLASK